MEISPTSLNLLNKITEAEPAKKSVSSGIEAAGSSFEEILSSLNASQQNADELVNKVAEGDDVDLHTVMIALEENDINFQVALSIRNKLVDAYQELMRMQV